MIGNKICLAETFCPEDNESTAMTLQLGTKTAIITAAIAIPSLPNKSATIANLNKY